MKRKRKISKVDLAAMPPAEKLSLIASTFKGKNFFPEQVKEARKILNRARVVK